MSKKKKYIILSITVLLLIISIIFTINNKNHKTINKDTNISNNTPTDSSLVLYFSVTNNTKTIAEYIKEITGSDIIEIIPTEKYSNADINYSNNDSRATKEQHNDKARPKIKNKIDIDEYDTIYLG